SRSTGRATNLHLLGDSRLARSSNRQWRLLSGSLLHNPPVFGGYMGPGYHDELAIRPTARCLWNGPLRDILSAAERPERPSLVSNWLIVPRLLRHSDRGVATAITRQQRPTGCLRRRLHWDIFGLCLLQAQRPQGLRSA